MPRTPLISIDAHFDIILSYSVDRILWSLTRAPLGTSTKEFNNGASLISFNILVYMGDKPAPECQRLVCRNTLLGLASKSCSWREEVYLQLLKQLTGNKSPTSIRLGLELLRALCDAVPPHGSLGEFVRAFIHHVEPEPELQDNSG